MPKKPTFEILEKVIGSRVFGFCLLVLTPVVSALIALIKKDWTWVAITVGVVLIIVFIAYILSALTSKITKDIVGELISQDGKLDHYLKSRVDELSKQFLNCSSCMTDVQKECRKSIESFFLQQYSEIKFFNIDEILEFEEAVQNGLIWIITDELGTDIKNEKIRNAIASNLNDGTVYNYFYTQKEIGIDAGRRLKSTFKNDYNIENVDNQMFFQKVGHQYDALLNITKDIVILNPMSSNRRAFLSLFANEDFDIAFYRELDDYDTTLLCGMIETKELTGNK